MKVDHRTESVDAVQREGVLDGVGTSGISREVRGGVSLSDQVLDGNEGAEGTQVIVRDLPDTVRSSEPRRAI